MAAPRCGRCSTNSPASSSGSRPRTIPPSAPRAPSCAMRWARSIAAAAGCSSASPRRRTTRSRARRLTLRLFGSTLGGCVLANEALAARDLGEGNSLPLRDAGAVLRRERFGTGWFAGAHRDRRRRRRQRRRCGAAGVGLRAAAIDRHCEPTGRANARPMINSTKQSMPQHKERMDCFVANAPLRKRFAFVAGNDGKARHTSAISPRVSREF